MSARDTLLMALVRLHNVARTARRHNVVRTARRGTGPQAFRPTTG
jgi:hypothetical protein